MFGRGASPVCVFGDTSNLFGGARAVAQSRAECRVRVHASHLLELLADGREVTEAVAILNTRYGPGVERAFVAGGWRTIRVEPGALSGREQFADEALAFEIIRAVESTAHPPVIVLATGDGAGAGVGRGFIP